MRDPLQQLYKTKLTLLATIFTVVGLALLVLVRWLGGQPAWGWLTRLPVADIGSALFTTGFVGIVFTYFDARDNEERASLRLKRVIQAEAPTIRDAVIDGFAFKREDLARVATPERLDEIITNSLALRLGDAAFAEDIYTDIRDQAIRATERWYDCHVSVRLSMDKRGAEGAPRLFVVTTTWEYTVVPTMQLRRFACVGNKADERELQQDQTTSVWYVSSKQHIEAATRDAFELVQFSVDGAELHIRRSARASGQTYSVDLGREMIAEQKPVTISYTYRTVVPERGHLLYLGLEQPAKGFDVELDYSDCGIESMSALDFIASSERTRISHSPASVPGQRVSVGFDGWVFPRSGVGFVWISEMG